MYEEYLQTIVNCLNETRKIVLKEIGKPEAKKVVKRSKYDTTKLIDKIAEDYIIQKLDDQLDSYRIISEECGVVEKSKSKPIIVIDPLDGSTNAIRGYPCYSISIAFALEPKLSGIVAGGVMNVVTGDIFTAIRGEGAYLNGKSIKPSNTKKIEDALIAVDLNIRSRISGYIAKLSHVIEKANHFRFIGSNALEICFVAAGICDAFIDLRGFLRVTDFAAACFIVNEAGGVIVNDKGDFFDFNLELNERGKFIAACTYELSNEILSLYNLNSFGNSLSPQKDN